MHRLPETSYSFESLYRYTGISCEEVIEVIKGETNKIVGLKAIRKNKGISIVYDTLDDPLRAIEYYYFKIFFEYLESAYLGIETEARKIDLIGEYLFGNNCVKLSDEEEFYDLKEDFSQLREIGNCFEQMNNQGKYTLLRFHSKERSMNLLKESNALPTRGEKILYFLFSLIERIIVTK